MLNSTLDLDSHDYSSGVVFFTYLSTAMSPACLGNNKLGGEQLRERLVTLEICLFGGWEKTYSPNGGEFNGDESHERICKKNTN